MDGMVIGIDEVDFEYSLDSGTTWVVLEDAKSIFIPETKTEWRDRTTTAVTDRHKRYGRGMKDTSEGAINCFHTRRMVKLAALMEAVTDPDGVSFRATFPPEADQSAGDAYTYKSHVELAYSGAAETDGDAMCSLNLRPSGPVTYTEGAAL